MAIAEIVTGGHSSYLRRPLSVSLSTRVDSQLEIIHLQCKMRPKTSVLLAANESEYVDLYINTQP